MKSDCLTVPVRQRQAYEIQSPAHVIRSWFKAALGALAGLMLFTSFPAFAQQPYAMQFNQGNNRFGTINLSSADLYVVPGSILPVPEPNAFLLSITGGVIFLLISRKRMQC